MNEINPETKIDENGRDVYWDRFHNRWLPEFPKTPKEERACMNYFINECIEIDRKRHGEKERSNAFIRVIKFLFKINDSGFEHTLP